MLPRLRKSRSIKERRLAVVAAGLLGEIGKMARRGAQPALMDDDGIDLIYAVAAEHFTRTYKPRKGAPYTWARWSVKYALRYARACLCCEYWRDGRYISVGGVTLSSLSAIENESGEIPLEVKRDWRGTLLDAPDPCSEAIAREDAWEARRDVARLLTRLNDVERVVIQARIWEGKSLRQVGEEIGRSGEWVRRVEVAAILKMRGAHTDA